MKCRSISMSDATWSSLPMSDSICFIDTFGCSIMFWISVCHSLNFSLGRCILRVLVFIVHSRTIFTSDGWTSALIFFKDMISFRGMDSFGCRDRATVCIASIAAAQVRMWLSFLFNAINIVSSMNKSAFPMLFSGGCTANGSALANGIWSGSRFGVSISFDNLSWNACGPMNCFGLACYIGLLSFLKYMTISLGRKIPQRWVWVPWRGNHWRLLGFPGLIL